MNQRAEDQRHSAARGVALAVWCVAVALVASSCAGAIERDEFEAMVDSRGGGLSNDLVVDALGVVGDRIGTDDLELTDLSANPGSRVVVITVRNPERRQDLDRYVVARGSITDVSPVRVSESDDIDAEAYLVSSVPALERLAEIGDEALETLGFEGGHVESISVRRPGGEAPRLSVSVSSPRASGVAWFSRDGLLEEARRS